MGHGEMPAKFQAYAPFVTVHSQGDLLVRATGATVLDHGSRGELADDLPRIVAAGMIGHEADDRVAQQANHGLQRRHGNQSATEYLTVGSILLAALSGDGERWQGRCIGHGNPSRP
jgi:hypothetical protein